MSSHVGVMRAGKLVFQGELGALRRAAPRIAVRTPDLTAAAEVLKKVGLAAPVAGDDAITANSATSSRRASPPNWCTPGSGFAR